MIGFQMQCILHDLSEAYVREAIDDGCNRGEVQLVAGNMDSIYHMNHSILVYYQAIRRFLKVPPTLLMSYCDANS